MIYKLLILLSIFTISSYSQEEQETKNNENISTLKKDELKYDINLFFPLKVIHQYRMDEETEVTREYDDGTKYSYKKRLTWFVSFYAQNISTRDGEKEVYAAIDSIDYEFDDGKYKAKFNNSGEYIPPAGWDFEKTFLANAKDFTMFYDSYNKAYDVQSDQIDADLRSLKKYNGKNAEFKKEQVSRRLSDRDLIFIADPVKNLLPSTSVSLDSSWKVNFNFDVDFINFANTCSATLSDIAGTNYIIKMKADTLYCIDTTMLFDDIKKIGKVDAGLASGDLELSISTRGHVKYLTTNFNATIFGKIDNIKFIEKKKSRVSWNLVGMWNQ